MATYKLITSYTVGAGGTSSISFNSIPQTYTDLLIVGSVRMSNSALLGYNTYRFNGDTGNNYPFKVLNGYGSGIYNGGGTTSYLPASANGNTSTSNTFSNYQIYIPNYTGSSYKTASNDVVVENNATEAYIDFLVSTWNNTSAITSITVNDVINSSNFMQYSTIYIYGIKNS